MQLIHKEALEYLNTQRVGVLAVEMLDGSPHAATVHFAHLMDPFILLFETDRPYRKSEALFGREISRASFVTGFDEVNSKTVQLDGTVQLLREEEQEPLSALYLSRFPEKTEKAKNPKCVFFKFTPTWWRYTDWTKPEGKWVVSSDQN